VPKSQARAIQLDTVDLYTDGSASPNPGPGGWAAILVAGGRRRELSGHETHTTNNRMELRAALEGLRALPRSKKVRVHTDSQYVRLGITAYLPQWRRTGWKTRARRPVANQDLWQALDEETAGREVAWAWVRGHSGHPLNEAADRLAQQAIVHRQTKARPYACPQEECEAYLGVSASLRHARWAVVLMRHGVKSVLHGEQAAATANALVLLAAIHALRRCPKGASVAVHASARYLIDGAARSLNRWRTNGWRTASGGQVLHRAMWEEIASLAAERRVRWEWKAYAPLLAEAEHRAAGGSGKFPEDPR